MKKGPASGCFIAALLLLTSHAYGQATMADTPRINALIDTAWAIADAQTDRAEGDLRAAISLSQQIPYHKGEASAWNALGMVEEVRGNTEQAIQHYQKALQLRESLGDKKGMASLFNNLGVAYETLGDYDQALEYHRKNLVVVEDLRDAARIARAQLNIAGVLEARGHLNEANDHAYIARQLIETTPDSNSIAAVYTTLGNIRYELDLYSDARILYEKALQIRLHLGDTLHIAGAWSNLGNALDEIGKAKKLPDSTRLALDYYKKALEIRERFDDQAGIASLYINLGDAYKHLGQFQRAMEHLQKAAAIYDSGIGEKPDYILLYENIADVHTAQKDYPKALEYTERYFNIALETDNEKFQQKGYKDFSDIHARMGNFAKAYEYRVLYDELRYRRLDEARAQDFSRREVLFSEGRRQTEIERQQNEIKLKNAELDNNRLIGIALAGIALVFLLLLLVMVNSARARARANRELAAKNAIIEQERERADLLLKNILPDSVATELKLTNSVKPMRYESVTVMFSDFRNFTKIAEEVSPEDLVAELDECFQMFDSIIEVCGLEKIKTIGDSYMCAGGIPLPNDTHAHDVLKAAIAMQIGLGTLMQQKQAEGKPVFEMRIGIHTGPVVAGIVGSRKFAYDIWGDTVNTAARLEQGSEAGKINISETTYHLVKEAFPCTFRGNLAAKNKGEIAMYFVDY